MGLWPNPARSPLNAEITHRVERDGYSIENVRFQSLPGFYVTGNLYRPADDNGPGGDSPGSTGSGNGLRPAILNPHGHWTEGRLAHEPDGSIPARCINFALQGYVAFAWSMAGYNDSTQLAHRTFGDDRKQLWGLSLMGLQLWNGMRSVDFLQSLPDVDNSRIACTGASGGGTQTFMLTAVDDRVRVAAPVNMVSAHMQGGCICENGPNLRIETNNMEIAALAAPRPLLLVSATADWTVNTPVLEYPAIRAVYALYDAEDCIWRRCRSTRAITITPPAGKPCTPGSASGCWTAKAAIEFRSGPSNRNHRNRCWRLRTKTARRSGSTKRG